MPLRTAILVYPCRMGWAKVDLHSDLESRTTTPMCDPNLDPKKTLKV